VEIKNMKICYICKEEKEEKFFEAKKGKTTEKCKTCKNSHQIEYYNRKKFHFPFQNYLNSLKGRCKKNNIKCNLTAEHLENIWTPVCPITNMHLVWEHDPKNDASAELDRLNPALGYVEGNVSWISRRANMLKANSTIEELEAVLSFLKRDRAPIYNMEEEKIILDGVSLKERRETFKRKTRKRNTCSKLTEEQVLEIKQLLKDKAMSQKDIAKKFNIGIKNLWKIKTGKSWKHIGV
jgi:hypothetical protein